MARLTIGGIIWPSNFRIIAPGEQLIGTPERYPWVAYNSIFGCVGFIDEQVAERLRLPAVPVDVDGGSLYILECRDYAHSVHQGLVVIRYGGAQSDGRIAGVSRKLNGYDSINDALCNQYSKAMDAILRFSMLQDNAAVDWLVAHGVPVADATTRLPEFRRLSVKLQSDAIRTAQDSRASRAAR